MAITQDNIKQAAQSVLNLINKMSPEKREANKDLIRQVVAKLRAKSEEFARGKEVEPIPPPEEPERIVGGGGDQPIQVPDLARELWALSRGDPDTFALYMRSYPNPELNNISNSPGLLNAVMNQINSTQSELPLGQADGIQQAPLQSSNVYGFRYDPLGQKLTVRFQDGSIYRYDQVPKIVFDMFRNGEGVARTTGRNKFGRWWKGKNPSLGAAVHQILIAGQFPYQKVR